jgi:hypothetical protein
VDYLSRAVDHAALTAAVLAACGCGHASASSLWQRVRSVKACLSEPPRSGSLGGARTIRMGHTDAASELRHRAAGGRPAVGGPT